MALLGCGPKVMIDDSNWLHGYRNSVLIAGLVGQPIAARLQRHHDLFQRTVAGALTDAVDGAFDLARPACTAASEFATDNPRSS